MQDTLRQDAAASLMHRFAVSSEALRALTDVQLSSGQRHDLQEAEVFIQNALRNLVKSAQSFKTCLGVSSGAARAALEDLESRHALLEHTIVSAIQKALQKLRTSEGVAVARWRQFKNEGSVVESTHKTRFDSMITKVMRR
mmetsp:Transcript_902/g.3127  ORF Transcript_902/g.3127 Transcript_902/m.3127 type:complete len:141 (-) Transcript_902:72-494(-)|eukprot:scaffold153091_cov35-Tisochrysis_lutea.AAC.1